MSLGPCGDDNAVNCVIAQHLVETHYGCPEAVLAFSTPALLVSSDRDNDRRADAGMTLAPITQQLAEALNAWAFNVMLECSGREEDKLEVVIGGAIIDLRDLHDVLEWARITAGMCDPE